MTNKALWMLDIDGVVNACPRNPDPPPGIWPAHEWVSVEVSNSHSVKPWPILASRAVLDFIIDVHTTGLAEVVWHSTWAHEANKVGAALGLPEFEVLEAPEYEGWTKGAKGWWKLPAARRALRDSGGHLIWTDDDATTPDMPMGERRLWKDAGALIIAPNAYQGLSPQNLDKIKWYLVGDWPNEPLVVAA